MFPLQFDPEMPAFSEKWLVVSFAKLRDLPRDILAGYSPKLRPVVSN
jgi:hypothetical protein